SPRSTSTTDRTCRCGTGCPPWPSGCCRPPSPPPSSPAPSGGRGQARRETAGPVAEIGDNRVEAGRIAGRDRVGDGPVHRDLAPESLPGQVADRDHEIVIVPDLADVAGPEPRQRQAVAAGGGDRTGIDPLGGPGAGRDRR